MRRDLRGAMVRFAALLRTQGLPVTPGHVTDGVRSLEVLDLADRDEVRLGLRTVFVARPDDLPVFDRCFDAFWRVEERSEDGASTLAPPGGPEPAPGPEPGGSRQESVALDAWGEEEAEETGDPLDVPGQSDREALIAQDFSTFAPDQLEEVLRLTLLIARRLARRLGRRRRPVARRGRVDLRGTLRANLMRADVVELRYRRRKRRKVRLVLLCDVSGSMDLYSRFLLQFLFALQNLFARVETFVFSTRLARITDLLRGRSYAQVVRRLTAIKEWSGGTRIGASLAEVDRRWAHLLDRRTIVIVLSDGWDTGEPEILADALRRLRRRAGRLIWLNPLLGNPSYEPLTRGMQAALPLVDDFAPAHNLAALRDLAHRLTL